MGGQSIAKDGFIIDTVYMNRMIYDQSSKTVTVGPGVTWGDLIMVCIYIFPNLRSPLYSSPLFASLPSSYLLILIQYLNQYGMSPQIMQSYCSFSVGGTISGTKKKHKNKLGKNLK